MEKKYVFFLGGYDAEMLTIKGVLDTNRLPYFDHHLSWGASLSAYREELNNLPADHIPVLIELRLDIPYPEHAVIIDHHNERAGKDQKTSLEQVADLMGIRLTRYQCLISANDRGHVPAMRELGAEPGEIDDIRKFDRQCQGVTKEDETHAEISIRKHSEILSPQAILINSLTEKSSPVLDRLYDKYAHIFIITPDNDFSYFGPGTMVNKLEEIYGKLKKKQTRHYFLERR